MFSHAIDLLEFDKIVGTLKETCLSEDGIRLLDEQKILTDPVELSELLDQVDAMGMILDNNDTFPALSFPEVSDIVVHAAKEGTILEAEQLAAVAVYLRSTGNFRNFLTSAKISQNNPVELTAERIPDFAGAVASLFSVVEESGVIRDDIPALRSILKRIRNLKSELLSNAGTYIQNNAEMWQTNVPTQKDGRTVLPLKADYRGRLKGVVRDLSSSGATIFIEPLDLVEKNNQVAILDHEYRMAVVKILRESTAVVRAAVPDIEFARTLVAFLDTIYARAVYGKSHSCVRAKKMDRGFALTMARHPLLGKTAVPIDVLLDPETYILIITGPNAGGKTVTLKTIGLFALMNQFGMGIPAEEDSGISLFEGINADIGDDQSIEQSLSTFSGHMNNIASFLEAATGQSLVLLDELGAGTDPEEGSAISMAILEFLLDKKCTAVATTHHGVLKNFGFTTEGVMNASVSFDAETHSPTYRIILGLPGESHAFDIARRSGIQASVLKKAQELLDNQSTDVAHVIRQITSHQRELTQKEADHEKRNQELLEKVRQTDLHALRLRQQEMELKTHKYEKMSEELHTYRSQLENLVRKLREGELTKQKTREVKQFLEHMEDNANQERLVIEQTKRELLPKREIAPGVEVLIGKSRQVGTVLRKAREGYWTVATDRMKVTVSEEEIQEVRKKQEDTKAVRVSHTAISSRASFSLDVRGYRLTEAINTVDQQIDRALLSGLYEFEIIHGHGEGVLQQGIQDYLKRHRAVKSYSFASPEAGGFGKTVVHL